jgi:hypothetical protein
VPSQKTLHDSNTRISKDIARQQRFEFQKTLDDSNTRIQKTLHDSNASNFNQKMLHDSNASNSKDIA